MDDLPPWEDDPEMTEVCPYCFLKHEAGRCLVQQKASIMLAALSEDVAVERAMSGD